MLAWHQDTKSSGGETIGIRLIKKWAEGKDLVGCGLQAEIVIARPDLRSRIFSKFEESLYASSTSLTIVFPGF
jgi:hypothetical protein